MLNKTALKNGLLQLMADMETREVDSKQEYANRLSDLIDDFVKSGDGVYQVASLKAGVNIVTANSPIVIKIE